MSQSNLEPALNSQKQPSSWNTLPVIYHHSPWRRLCSLTVLFEFRSNHTLSWRTPDNTLTLYPTADSTHPEFTVNVSQVTKALSEGNVIKLWVNGKKFTLPLGTTSYNPPPNALGNMLDWASTSMQYASPRKKLMSFLRQSESTKVIKQRPFRAILIGIVGGIALIVGLFALGVYLDK